MPSFDTVLEPDLVELRNAVDQATRKSARASTSRAQRQGRARREERQGARAHAAGRQRLPAPAGARRAAGQAGQARRRCPLPRPRRSVAEDRRRQGQAARAKVKSGIDSERQEDPGPASRPASSRCRPPSRATRCASPAPSATTCRPRWRCCARRCPNCRCPSTTSATEAGGCAALSPHCTGGAAGRAAQGVTLSGRMGSKALLVIDGQPQMLAVGETARGVRLLRSGRRGPRSSAPAACCRCGWARPAQRGRHAGGARSAAQEIVIAGGPAAGISSPGAPSTGGTVRFMVDTGATMVAIGRADAERIGLDSRSGQRGVTQTANGP
jgi:hypothetical protein